MRLDVTLVDRLGVKLPLHHHVRVLEAPVQVACLKLKVVGDVAPFGLTGRTITAGAGAGAGLGYQPLVKKGSALLHGVVGI